MPKKTKKQSPKASPETNGLFRSAVTPVTRMSPLTEDQRNSVKDRAVKLLMDALSEAGAGSSDYQLAKLQVAQNALFLLNSLGFGGF
jgi:hypothetical protein